jgi:hypothetical protein
MVFSIKAIVAGFYLGSASYGPRRFFRSARWFKYVSAAELIPVFKNAPLPVKIFALLKFLGAGVVGSLFSGLHEEFRRGCEVRGFKTPRGGICVV